MVGPMARSSADLAFAACVTIGATVDAYERGAYKFRGEQIVPIPWREEVLQSRRRLRIGYYVEDGAVKVSAEGRTCVSVRLMARRALRVSAGSCTRSRRSKRLDTKWCRSTHRTVRESAVTLTSPSSRR